MGPLGRWVLSGKDFCSVVVPWTSVKTPDPSPATDGVHRGGFPTPGGSYLGSRDQKPRKNFRRTTTVLGHPFSPPRTALQVRADRVLPAHHDRVTTEVPDRQVGKTETESRPRSGGRGTHSRTRPHPQTRQSLEGKSGPGAGFGGPPSSARTGHCRGRRWSTRGSCTRDDVRLSPTCPAPVESQWSPSTGPGEDTETCLVDRVVGSQGPGVLSTGVTHRPGETPR